jgi:hypothetical protein
VGFLADAVGPMRAIDIVETICFVWVAWIGMRWRRREHLDRLERMRLERVG